MLFPPPPEGFRYFQAKSSNGVLAKFCSVCGCHLDNHAYQWLTGGHGTVRACPPEHQIAPAPQVASSTSGQNSETSSAAQSLNASSVGFNNNQNTSMMSNQSNSNISNINRPGAQRQNHPHESQNRTYGSHHLYKEQHDVDISLTSSVVNEKKTVGAVPAHHRFHGSRGTSVQDEQQQERLAKQEINSSSNPYHPRSIQNVPQPMAQDQRQHHHPSSEQQYYKQPQQQQQQQEEEYYYDDRDQQQQEHYSQQQQQEGSFHRSTQPGGKNFHLYDEAYSTPVPFGTEVDLVNPPHVAGPKGRRHIDRNYYTTEQQVHWPKARQLKAQMERSNMFGSGGACVSEDAVRPREAVPKSHITKQRKDAESKIAGAGGSWHE